MWPVWKMLQHFLVWPHQIDFMSSENYLANHFFFFLILQNNIHKNILWNVFLSYSLKNGRDSYDQ